VNYGVNEVTKYLLQAVPFLAKDIPSERSQYAKIDMAIVLTTLSYYYSGLDQSNLDLSFKRLISLPEGASIYHSWVDYFPSDFDFPQSLSDFNGINLEDKDLRVKTLKDLFIKHPLVSFWMNFNLFPKEGKEFPQVLSASSWDLCEVSENLTTGFSGTNDTKILLPLSIQYHGLPSLLSTNGLLINNLILPENRGYRCLPKGFKNKQLLKLLIEVAATFKSR
jgi:hypothetical protein